jgi:hypothetical protein
MPELADGDVLDGDMPYQEGNGSDKCEEEVNQDSEIDAYYNRVRDEYESEEEDWGGFPDSPDEAEDAATESSEIAE